MALFVTIARREDTLQGTVLSPEQWKASGGMEPQVGLGGMRRATAAGALVYVLPAGAAGTWWGMKEVGEEGGCGGAAGSLAFSTPTGCPGCPGASVGEGGGVGGTPGGEAGQG